MSAADVVRELAGLEPDGELVRRLELMEGADPETLCFHCYSGRAVEDDLSDRLRARCASWRRTDRLSDCDLAAAIEADGIDILVDLSGHTAGNRLGCFALKPAPVQVTAWGSGTGTGLQTMDYFFADPVIIPQDVRHEFAECVYDLPSVITMEPI